MTTDELRKVLGPVGIWMPPPAAAGVEAGAFGQEIEAAGFTSVWFPGMNSLRDLAAVEPMLAATQRLVLGTGIANIWTWEPAALAAEATRLNAAYPGRFILGLGVSHAPAVAAYGMTYEKPYSKMVSFLDALPAVDVPLILAALGPRMLRLAKERSAGAHPYFAPPEHTAIARAALGDAPLLIPELAASLTPGPDGAAAARAYAAFYLRLPNYTSNLRKLGYTDADLDDGGSDRMMSRVVPHGPDEAGRRLREHLAAGADHVVVQLVTAGGKFDTAGLGQLAELTADLR